MGKLNRAQVAAVVRRVTVDRESMAEVAHEYGVTPQTVAYHVHRHQPKLAVVDEPTKTSIRERVLRALNDNPWGYVDAEALRKAMVSSREIDNALGVHEIVHVVMHLRRQGLVEATEKKMGRSTYPANIRAASPATKAAVAKSQPTMPEDASSTEPVAEVPTPEAFPVLVQLRLRREAHARAVEALLKAAADLERWVPEEANRMLERATEMERSGPAMSPVEAEYLRYADPQ